MGIAGVKPARLGTGTPSGWHPIWMINRPLCIRKVTLKRIYVDLQAADQHTIGIGLESDIGQELHDGERVILYDEELEVEATLHSSVHHGHHGTGRYWIGTFDIQDMRQKTS